MAANDPVNFCPADAFFQQAANFRNASDILSIQSSSSSDPTDKLRYAALINLGDSNDGTSCLVQFATPQIWRIRYDPRVKTLDDYTDANSRVIVQDSFAALVDILQNEFKTSKAFNSPKTTSNWFWNTTFEQLDDQTWCLSSVEHQDANDPGTVNTKLYFSKSPFRITATRVLGSNSKAIPSGTSASAAPSTIEKIVWQTSTRPITFQPPYLNLANVTFTVEKPGSAEYVGFGEQGGSTLMKTPTFMNFFCYDNYNYQKLYGEGPLDPREPLYYSNPFWIELNGNPGYSNITGTLVDNYSQVVVDLGKTNSGEITLGTRFGTFDMYAMSADNISDLLFQYTGLIGRPRLKPRYVLGHHQGCYGWTSSSDVRGVVQSYRNAGIPLDGMHLDVDFQYKYRTFTVDQTQNAFPDVVQMFSDLRNEGVKCCTNITPILSLDGYTGSDAYKTIQQAWDQSDPTNAAKNFLVMEHRYKDGLPNSDPSQITYMRYDRGGNPGNPYPIYTYANDQSQRLKSAAFPNGDDYNFTENYDSGYPYHGAVSYGSDLGITGFYPDLNREVVRTNFWGPQYQDLFDMGLEFIWQDMTTPAVQSAYGDMLGFPSRLLMSTDPYDQNPSEFPPQKPAIELWGLYSYNLHKATYNGLNSLKGREDKRNFIIGRGSLTGQHRYAGLWTGDNASTWDFWKICVAQVLALGYGGLTIAGVDMGGFAPNPAYQSPQWCDPDLLIRWYSGAFLLPWYRNHYIKHFSAKEFQEPYNYSTAMQNYPIIPRNLGSLYAAVEPICKYYVQLRYSLMQVMYDAMFANLIHGLPIARPMLVTDPDDTSLLNEAAAFVDNQYLLGHYILVCPVMEPDDPTTNSYSRDVYLPQTNSWYAFNLRIDGSFGIPLQEAVPGGSITSYDCSINGDPNHIPYITPIYIREGSILPQIQVRQFVGDKSSINPVTIHVYPGADNTYSMYLDDGVSRSSAPADLPQYKFTDGDNEAKSEYREVMISQTTSQDSTTRTVTLSHPWNNYNAEQDMGNTYNVVVWRDTNASSTAPTVAFTDETGAAASGCQSNFESSLNATVATIPTTLANSTSKLIITVKG